MICPKCGGSNLEGSTLCVKCGTSLKDVEETVEETVEEEVTEEVTEETTEEVVEEKKTKEPKKVKEKKDTNIDIKDTAMGFFTYCVSVFTKPFESFKKQSEKFEKPANGFMFAGFIALAMMIVNLLVKMIAVVFYKNWDGKLVVSFKNLKYLKFFDLTLKNLIIYAVIIVAIAGIYYIVALILKKTVSYPKMVAAVATSYIPFIVLGMFAPTIFAYIWTPLAIISIVVASLATYLIFIYLMDDIVKFDKVDMKIYYHLICLTALFIIAGLILNKSISGMFSGLM